MLVMVLVLLQGEVVAVLVEWQEGSNVVFGLFGDTMMMNENAIYSMNENAIFGINHCATRRTLHAGSRQPLPAGAESSQ